ncbi:MAG: BlaI/MecI/CopY family transcriptional regulator [Acidimicrobiales bacterium]
MSALRPFGELESAVMDRLWAADRPLSVRDVLEDLQKERALAYTTVMTVMDNLHRKGWLTRQRERRAYLYRPTGSREVYAAGLMSQAFTQAGDPAATLVHFIEAMSPDEAAALRRALSDQPGTEGEVEQ